MAWTCISNPIRTSSHRLASRTSSGPSTSRGIQALRPASKAVRLAGSSFPLMSKDRNVSRRPSYKSTVISAAPASSAPGMRRRRSRTLTRPAKGSNDAVTPNSAFSTTGRSGPSLGWASNPAAARFRDNSSTIPRRFTRASREPLQTPANLRRGRPSSFSKFSSPRSRLEKFNVAKATTSRPEVVASRTVTGDSPPFCSIAATIVRPPWPAGELLRNSRPATRRASGLSRCGIDSSIRPWLRLIRWNSSTAGCPVRRGLIVPLPSSRNDNCGLSTSSQPTRR